MAYAPLYYGYISATGETNSTIIRLTRNDSYATVSFTVNYDYTGYTGLLTIRHRVTNTQLSQVSVTVSSATVLTATFTTSDTAFATLTTDADFGPHPFDIQMTSGGTVTTEIKGSAIITRDVTT